MSRRLLLALLVLVVAAALTPLLVLRGRTVAARLPAARATRGQPAIPEPRASASTGSSQAASTTPAGDPSVVTPTPPAVAATSPHRSDPGATRATATTGAVAPSPPAGTPPTSSASATPARPDGQTSTASAGATRPGYVVTANEAYPVLKRLADEVAVALTTYGPDATPGSVAGAVTTDPAEAAALAVAAAPLVHAGMRSTGTVVYPQMGGISSDAASVMVVTRQTLTGPGGGRVETRTLDVWLRLVGSTWRFWRLDSAGGTPVARPADLSPLAAAVVDDPRITLPDSARWDIYRGAISPVLLQLMLQIAARTPYAVTVLETGHPFDVFGTGNESMHSAGRAVDINELGGIHVIDLHQVGSPAYDLVTWLLQQPELGQVGSPWMLGDNGYRSFTNSVHQDHIHVSV